MKTMLFLVFAMSLNSQATQLVQYGHEVGNGGNILLCKNNQGEITKTELLDLFEARALRGLESDLGDPKEDFHLKIERVLNNLAQVAPFRGDKYKKIYQSFFQETAMVPDADLVFIPDAENIVVPKNCDLKQVAIQRPPEFPGDKRYTISKDYWDMMDNNSRAGLVLHEIIYNEAIFLGHVNSKAVRYLNSYFTSKKLKTLNQQDLAYMFYSTKFVVADLFGTLVRLDKYTADGDWAVSGIYFWDDKKNYYKDATLPLIINYDNVLTLRPYFVLEAQNNELISAQGVMSANFPNFTAKTVVNEFNSSFGITLSIGQVLKFTGGLVHYYHDGDYDYEVETSYLSIKLKSLGYSELTFIQGQYLNSFAGVVQFTHKNSSYVSPYILNTSNTYLENQKVKIGQLYKDSLLNTSQGMLMFRQNVKSENQLPPPNGGRKQSILSTQDEPIMSPPSDCVSCNNYTVFDVEKTVATAVYGLLRAGQKIRTDQGDVKLVKDSFVEFREDGVAEIRGENSN